MGPDDLFMIVFLTSVVFGVARVIWKERYKDRKKEVSSKQRMAELNAQIAADFEAYYEKLFAEQSFVNKETTVLDDFIINDQLNGYDLHKLAYLNGIKVEHLAGWYPLVLDLMRELDAKGWNRRVGSIKEKYGGLRFYANIDAFDIIEAYTEKSLQTCEVCGQPGELFIDGYWDQTLCRVHSPDNDKEQSTD